MKIAYEPHPVTPERKAELRSKGFKIIDARFGPKDTAGDAKQSVPESPDDIYAMGKAEVLEWIEAHGGKADKRKGVETLRAELASIMFAGLADGAND